MTNPANEWREFREDILTFFTGADHDIERVAEIQFEDMFKRHQTSISAHLVERLTKAKEPSVSSNHASFNGGFNCGIDQAIDIIKDNK